jgi:hypothetical protein
MGLFRDLPVRVAKESIRNRESPLPNGRMFGDEAIPRGASSGPVCDLCTTTGSTHESVALHPCQCACAPKDLDPSPKHCRVCYHDLRRSRPDRG